MLVTYLKNACHICMFKCLAIKYIVKCIIKHVTVNKIIIVFKKIVYWFSNKHLYMLHNI